ncbi:MAG: class I SAM-dependent methyltransferase [Chlorogloea purpurea SAG 13.99]|nr:class I SAM-dependent methyltransferase [Chlorogloea purpurea SAG 13.99]
MSIKKLSIVALLIGLLASIITFYNFTYSPVEANNSPYYQTRKIHSRDGIGKFYLGREIAKVMGHQEILWLERPSRTITEQPDKVIEALSLKPDDTVADIGAGSGYFTFRLASLVPGGKVLAVDIQPEMLDVIDFIKNDEKINNIEPILGTETNPNLPADSVALALMVDAYHEFAYPREMMENLVEALKDKGRVVLLEYRLENPLVPIKALHKMAKKQVKKEMLAVGLTLIDTKEFLPQQHLFVFQKNNS